MDYAADYTVTAIGNSHANQADGDYFEIASKDGNIQFYLDSAASGTVTVPAAPPQMCIRDSIMRDPLVALDRTQNLTLVTDGPTDGWKFVFAPTPNANVDPNSAYKVTYNVGDTPNTQTGHEDNGQIAIGLSGLFDQTTTSPTTGSVDTVSYTHLKTFSVLR